MATVTKPILLDETGQAILSKLNEVSILPQIVDNLTTSDATKALSAKQGKVLDDSKMGIKPYSSKNFNDYITAGVYSIGNLSEFSNSPNTSTNGSWGNLLVLRGGNTDTIKQIYYNYNSTKYSERQGSGIGTASPSWGAWTDSMLYFCIGSQVLYDHYELDSATKQNLIGAPDDALFSGIWESIPIPPGYHKEYKITCQVTTTSSNKVAVGINNISTVKVSTWSANTYKFLTASSFFKYSDIVFEPVLNYPSQSGCNLWISNESGGIGRIYFATIHAFLVKD